MIERLVAGLRDLSELDPSAPPVPETQALIADCADAIRLELDCLQQELTADQREALESLGDLLASDASIIRIRSAARTARRALGLDAARGGA